MKVITVIGQTYALRSKSGGDLTNEAGDVLETLEPGVQLHVTAQEPAWVLPEDCQVTACRTFKNAALALGLLGGGEPSWLTALKSELAFILDGARVQYKYSSSKKHLLILTDLSDDSLNDSVLEVCARLAPQGTTYEVFNLNKYAECETLLDVSNVNPDWYNDITSEREWIYPLTNAVSVYDNENFGFNGMFTKTKAKRIYVDAPKLTNADYLISANANVKYAWLNMPAMSKIAYIALNNNVIEEIEGYMPNAKQVNITYRFDSNCKLRRVKIDFPKLSVGNAFLPGAILDKESTLRILNSIPRWTSGTHNLTIGIHVDHKYDPEVNEALKRADMNYEPLNLPIDEATGDYVEITEGKGWTLTVQWNGTATENAYPNPAATYSLRPQTSPVYAKLATSERPDGALENYLDWGHYVTNWEETGYMEFASLEEAREYFNITE